MILPPEYIREVYEYCTRINDLSRGVSTFDTYLPPVIEIYFDGEPIGARLVDDCMAQVTYNVEFYNPEDK
jgi:hypothetical protein